MAILQAASCAQAQRAGAARSPSPATFCGARLPHSSLASGSSTWLASSSQQLLQRQQPGSARGRGASRTPLPPRAALYALPPGLVDTLHTATAAAIVLGLGLSALPILTGEAAERNAERSAAGARPGSDQGVDNVRWSVMGVLSFIPLVNPLAWVFAAMDDEAASTLYYTFALIYSLPYLANGLEVDGWAVLALLAGAAHVQVERIAQTEAAEVELPGVARGLLRSLSAAVRGVSSYGASLGDEVGERARAAAQAQQRRPERKQLEAESREARMQLEEFDRRRRQREREAQSRGGSNGDDGASR